MKSPMKNAAIKVRLPEVLARAVENAAADRGMNLSEFIRSIAREKVGLA